jgi:alanine racemase
VSDPGAGRTTWVEISRGALRDNLTAVRRHAGVPVCAVVKANAYGCGLVESAVVFHRAGARMLGVTRLEEARALRDAGVAADILLLAPPPQDMVAEAFGLSCVVSLADGGAVDAYAAAARAAGRRGRVHLEVDTGMGRSGVRPEHAPAVAQRIAASPDLALEGVWTHLADAAGPGGRRQLDRLLAIRSAIERSAPGAVFHAANSAATLALPAARLDMVRVGTLLYGQQPPGIRAPFRLADPFAWWARVVAVRELPAGAPVGYGAEWRARRPCRVATLAVGYADGFGVEPAARAPSLAEAARAGARIAATALGRRPSTRQVWFGERPAPVIGRIGMQLTTVLVDGIPGVAPGSVARLPARRITVGAHVERVYVP